MGRNAPIVCMPQGNEQRQKATGKVFIVTESDAAVFNAVVADNGGLERTIQTLLDILSYNIIDFGGS